MRVIIAGPRDFSDPKELEAAISEAKAKGIEITEVVCGMARGADLMGKSWAERNGIPVKEFPADWQTHGKRAGHIRNMEMAKHGEALIAVSYDPPSPGTGNMIATALIMNLKVHVRKVPRSST